MYQEIEGKMNFLESITSKEMRDRFDKVFDSRPDTRVISYILPQDKKAEWLHSVGPGYDDIRALCGPFHFSAEGEFELADPFGFDRELGCCNMVALDGETLLGTISRKRKPVVLGEPQAHAPLRARVIVDGDRQ